MRTRRGSERSGSSAQNLGKLVVFLLTIGVVFVLGLVLLRIIFPSEKTKIPNPEGRPTDTPRPEGAAPPPPPTEATGPEDKTTEMRTYHGEGAEPADDPALVWAISLEIAGDKLLKLDGKVSQNGTYTDAPPSEFDFSIVPDHYSISMLEGGTPTVNSTDVVNLGEGSIFSTNEKNQLFVFVTPRNLRMATGTIPGRFLTKGQDTPLISLQAVVRKDGNIMGTLRSPFSPSVEFLLVPSPAP